MSSKLIGNIKDFTSKWHYLKQEVDDKLSGKSDVGHTHSDDDVSVTTTNYGSGLNQNSFNSYLSYDMIQTKNKFNGYYTKTEVDEKDNGLINKFNEYYNKAEVDENIVNEIEAMKKVAHMQLRTPLVVHKGVFGVYITDYAGNPITRATVKDKIEWGDSSTSTVTLSDQGGGIYQKSNFLESLRDIRVKNTITFTHKDYNSTTCFFQIYLI